MGVLVLAMLVSYSVWRTAQEGIVRMQGDVANAVKLETIKTHGKEVALKLHAAVQSVEFLDDKAMAAVVVTRTLPSGEVLVQAEARFYKQAPKGGSTQSLWRRFGVPAQHWTLKACTSSSARRIVRW